jgi:hypothetical protein
MHLSLQTAGVTAECVSVLQCMLRMYGCKASQVLLAAFAQHTHQTTAFLRLLLVGAALVPATVCAVQRCCCLLHCSWCQQPCNTNVPAESLLLQCHFSCKADVPASASPSGWPPMEMSK